eukprot:scaffold46692_cov52-Cyclotella_meneghiniana.AAC.1
MDDAGLFDDVARNGGEPNFCISAALLGKTVFSIGNDIGTTIGTTIGTAIGTCTAIDTVTVGTAIDTATVGTATDTATVGTATATVGTAIDTNTVGTATATVGTALGAMAILGNSDSEAQKKQMSFFVDIGE